MNNRSRRRFIRQGLAGAGLVVAGMTARGAWANAMERMEPNLTAGTAGPGRFTKESPYSVTTPKGIKCQICPNNCILKEGVESLCRTHVVKNGKLYSIAYGNPCSVHADPVEKKPLFHFLPSSRSFSIATAGCNFACLNCQNWEISQQSPNDTVNTDLYPDKVVEAALAARCSSVAYTYSEPVAFYEYMIDTARLARARGLKNLFISNGYINERPLRDLAVYLDAANINLKSFKNEIYEKLNGGSLEPVLKTLKTLKECGVWLEITNLVVPGWTDDLTMIRDMCGWLVSQGFRDNPLHFSRFHPLHKLTSLPFTPVEVLEKARIIAQKAGIRYVYIGNVPGNKAESTYCHSCGKTVLERRGFAILANNLNGNACRFCKTVIPGTWA